MDYLGHLLHIGAGVRGLLTYLDMTEAQDSQVLLFWALQREDCVLLGSGDEKAPRREKGEFACCAGSGLGVPGYDLWQVHT